MSRLPGENEKKLFYFLTLSSLGKNIFFFGGGGGIVFH